jgi:hypothetical protein
MDWRKAAGVIGLRARELLGDDGNAYKTAITKRYPDYRGAFIIDIANRYLFGAGHA